MMGRLKVMLSHTRNATMTMTEKTIRYEIPLYTESKNLGNLYSVCMNEGEIVLTYHRVADDTKPEVKQIEEKKAVVTRSENFNLIFT